MDYVLNNQMKNLTKLVITKPINGKQYSILAGKPTSIPNRGIYLLGAKGEKHEHTSCSLWLIELSEDGQNADLWPYEGDDTEELIEELWEEFVATAFD